MRAMVVCLAAALAAPHAQAAQCEVAGVQNTAVILNLNDEDLVMYPAAAVMDRVEGRGIARVTVDGKRRTSNGVILLDEPGNYRFGQEVLNALLMKAAFRRSTPGDYTLCFEFRDPANVHPIDNSLEPAPPVIRKQQPVWVPKKAAMAKQAGSARVEIQINDDGYVVAVGNVTATATGFGFERAAAVAAGRWRYAEDEAGRYYVKVDFDPAAYRPLLPSPWLPTPTFIPRSKMYPGVAIAKRVEGDVTLKLSLVPGGLMRRIEIVREEPEGYGFAMLALYHIGQIVLHPDVLNSEHEVDIRFRLAP